MRGMQPKSLVDDSLPNVWKQEMSTRNTSQQYLHGQQ